MTPWDWSDEKNLWINSVTGENMTAIEYDAHRCNRIAQLEAENEALRDGHEEIVLWGKAYPTDVFPEPDLKKAHKLLKAGGMTLDAVSASSMRHVLKGVVRIANDALLTGEQDA